MKIRRLVCWRKGHDWQWWMIGRQRIGEPFCARCHKNWDAAQRSTLEYHWFTPTGGDVRWWQLLPDILDGIWQEIKRVLGKRGT